MASLGELVISVDTCVRPQSVPLVGSRGRTSPVEEPRDVRAACSGGLGVRWDEDALRALTSILGTGCDASDMAKGQQILAETCITTHVSCTNLDCSMQSRKGLGVLGYSETSLTHFSSQAASDLCVESSHRFSKCRLQGKLAPTLGWLSTLCLPLVSSPPALPPFSEKRRFKKLANRGQSPQHSHPHF